MKKIDSRDARGGYTWPAMSPDLANSSCVAVQVHALYLFHPCYSRNCRNVLLTAKHSWGIGFFEFTSSFMKQPGHLVTFLRRRMANRKRYYEKFSTTGSREKVSFRRYLRTVSRNRIFQFNARCCLKVPKHIFTYDKTCFNYKIKSEWFQQSLNINFLHANTEWFQ